MHYVQHMISSHCCYFDLKILAFIYDNVQLIC